MSLATPSQSDTYQICALPPAELLASQSKRYTNSQQAWKQGQVVNEGNFQRITHLASRVFRTPVALVSLADTFQCLNSSPFCEDSSRQLAFSSHALLDPSDLYVVYDAFVDERYRTNPLVVSRSADFRFYAGAALRVHGHKIGVLSIVDCVSRDVHSFGEREKALLLDMAHIVSQQIEEKVSSNRRVMDNLAELTVSLLHGLQSPLQDLLNQKSRLMDKLQLAKDLILSTGAVTEFHDWTSEVSRFREALAMIEHMLETRLQVAHRVVDRSQGYDPINSVPKMKRCSFQQQLEVLSPMLSRVDHPNASVDKQVKGLFQRLSSRLDHVQFFSHPDLLSLVLSDLICEPKLNGANPLGKLEACEILTKVSSENVEMSKSESNNFVEKLECTIDAKSCKWNIGELIVSSIRLLPVVNNHQEKALQFEMLMSKSSSLRQMVRWFHGTVSMDYNPRLSQVKIQVVIPYRNIRPPETLGCGHQSPLLDKCVISCSSHSMVTVVPIQQSLSQSSDDDGLSHNRTLSANSGSTVDLLGEQVMAASPAPKQKPSKFSNAEGQSLMVAAVKRYWRFFMGVGSRVAAM